MNVMYYSYCYALFLLCTILIVMFYSYCYVCSVYSVFTRQMALFGYPDGGLLCFFLSCKANARV